MVRAIRELPEGYAEAGRVSLGGAVRVVAMNLLAAAVMVLSGVGVAWLVVALRGDGLDFGVQLDSTGSLLLWFGLAITALLLTPLVVAVAHEAVHGLLFWRLTGARPAFGVTIGYAYATAPGWFFTRAQLLLVLSAPLVALTVVAVPVAVVGPAPLAILLVYGMALNIGGSVGDLIFAIRLLRLPRYVLVADRRDGMRWYLPQAPAG